MLWCYFFSNNVINYSANYKFHSPQILTVKIVFWLSKFKSSFFPLSNFIIAVTLIKFRFSFFILKLYSLKASFCLRFHDPTFQGQLPCINTRENERSSTTTLNSWNQGWINHTNRAHLIFLKSLTLPFHYAREPLGIYWWWFLFLFQSVIVQSIKEAWNKTQKNFVKKNPFNFFLYCMVRVQCPLRSWEILSVTTNQFNLKNSFLNESTKGNVFLIMSTIPQNFATIPRKRLSK